MDNTMIIDECNMWLCMELDGVKELCQQLGEVETEQEKDKIVDKIEEIIKKEFNVEYIMYGE